MSNPEPYGQPKSEKKRRASSNLILSDVIKPIEEKILLALATYRFLNTEQLLALKLATRTQLYDNLSTLRRRQPLLIRELDFRKTVFGGARLYALTPRGAELLMQHGLVAKEPRSSAKGELFANDYWHRIACVNFHIYLREFVTNQGGELDFYDTYFDMVDNAKGFLPKTAMRFGPHVIVPDAMFAFTIKGVKRLCAVEVYRHKRTGLIEEKMASYLVALSERVIEKTYQYAKSVRVLLCFDDLSAMQLIQKRMRDTVGEGSPHFFLAPLDTLKEMFLDGWQRFDGSGVSLF